MLLEIVNIFIQRNFIFTAVKQCFTHEKRGFYVHNVHNSVDNLKTSIHIFGSVQNLAVVGFPICQGQNYKTVTKILRTCVHLFMGVFGFVNNISQFPVHRSRTSNHQKKVLT